MKPLMFLSLVIVLLAGCEDDPVSPKVQEKDLEVLLAEITELSTSETCEDPADWKFTAIGSKACGGPTGYIAYPNTIDESYFLDLVEQYTEAQAEYNEANGIVSDCSLPAEPAAIICVEGKPEFEY